MVVRVEGVVVGLVAGLVEDAVVVRDAGFFSAAAAPATVDLRSREEEVDFTGALVEGVLETVEVLEALPARDMRLADPATPLFSSPELSTDLAFSSAELLSDARDR